MRRASLAGLAAVAALVAGFLPASAVETGETTRYVVVLAGLATEDGFRSPARVRRR